MTVREFLSRVDGQELTEHMAYDLLERETLSAPSRPPIPARRTMPYDELEQRLDELWPPDA